MIRFEAYLDGRKLGIFNSWSAAVAAADYAGAIAVQPWTDQSQKIYGDEIIVTVHFRSSDSEVLHHALSNASIAARETRLHGSSACGSDI